MAWKRIIPIVVVLSLCCCASPPARIVHVGPSEGAFVVPTQQLIRPAGRSLSFPGRPIDAAVSPDGKTLYVKMADSVRLIDTGSWQVRQELKNGEKPVGGGTMHGIVVSRDGKRVIISTQSHLVVFNVRDDGKLSPAKAIEIPTTVKHRRSASYPCGMAWIGDEKLAVCLSINNSLAIVNLSNGTVEKEIPVGMAPYDVALSSDGTVAYVSNWGGRRPTKDDRTAESAASQVVIDERGVGSSGTLGVVDVTAGKMTGEIPTGLHPAQILLTRESTTLYVANANSDTVSVIDTASRAVRTTIAVRPEETLPFGSMSNALALSDDGKRLFVANGGNNAIAVVDVSSTPARIEGFIPAGWYPGALALRGDDLYIVNVKGVGSRRPGHEGKWNSHDTLGSVTLVKTPDATTLAKYTAQVRSDALVPQTLRAWEKAQSNVKPTPVPGRVGEPSTIEHVVYIIKENRTYDQMFGDLPRGNNDPKLCTFGRNVSPNHHALAEQFALLDNFYCNGVLSADGHAWVTEGVAVDYLEKSMGTWARSYPFPGDDALAMPPSGFIWDNVLLHGLTFRNYGEMSVTRREKGDTFRDIYNDWKNKTGDLNLTQVIANETLKKYSCPDSPGWNMKVPDQIRADVFLKEFEQNQKTGQFANLTIVYLPQDHTSGSSPTAPTTEAMVADNDLALGRVVDAISHSQFWPKTCIFVIEDDPQSGFDHVDGHRSICLVISPHTKRGSVVSTFYNQTSVLHTMELMLGCEPMNQFDAMAPVMHDVFTSKADTRPYTCLPNNIPLDRMNAAKAELSGKALQLAEASEKLPLDQPDMADEETFNRIIWHSVKGVDARYPAEFAGAHGKGLKALHLKLDSNVRDDDD